MARHQGWLTYRRRIISGASAFAVGAVAVLALSGVSAHASSSQNAHLGSSAVTVTVNAGDSVVFSADFPPFALNAKIKASSFPGDNDSFTLSGKHAAHTVAFSNAGSYSFSWTFTSLLGLPVKGGNSGTVEVAAAADPPGDGGGGDGGGGGSSSTPPVIGLPPLQGPGSSTSAGHSPGAGASSTAAGHHPGTGATATSTLPAYHLPGFSGPTFNHPGSPLPNGGVLSGRGTVPTGVAPPSSNATAPAATDQANVASVSSTPPSSPTALAIVAIAALAIVTAFYAHRLLGRQAARHITEP